MKFIGIDISKSTFVAAYPQLKGYQTQTYTNDLKGVKKFISSFSDADHQCVLEATGNYGTLLLYALRVESCKIDHSNPAKVTKTK
ncbi:IS110 family transposase [Chryseobacterium defluvii]|uniref:Transposase n=1 Tax=Chryseobacterium defluvii TaxID=160396 RepID=A0A495SN96_9FLAO|nr:transposase [Chryseobacterium defluvii]RKT01738.1 transposase [Chryseobacterium defluvii]